MKCHNTVTSKFDRSYAVGASIQPKVDWLNSERVKNEVLLDRKFPKVKVLPRYEE